MSSKAIYMQSPEGHVFTTDYPSSHRECKRLSKSEGFAALKAQSADTLRSILKPGDRVYCILRHVSSSGMQRRISFYAIEDGQMRMLDGLIANLGIASRHASKDGLVVNGCGMDMGFHVVYSLGYVLWPNGTPQPHGSRNGEPDSAGGYALKSEWL